MTTMATSETGDAEQAQPGNAFQVHLDNFEGPFDLLLALISKHKLDITEVALSSVTDEFITHIRALADAWDLDQASYFLVVAATLLDVSVRHGEPYAAALEAAKALAPDPAVLKPLEPFAASGVPSPSTLVSTMRPPLWLMKP